MTTRSHREFTSRHVRSAALPKLAAMAALCASSFGSSLISAATPPAPVTSVAPATNDTAQSHHEKAHACRVAKEFECALAELRAAYTLDPAPEILVNIGMVQYDLRRYEDALTSYRRALELGKDRLQADQKAEVQNRIAELERPVPVAVEINVPGATLWVDGSAKATSPLLAPLALLPGPHNLRVSRAGYQEQQRSVFVEPQGTLGPQQFVLSPHHPPPKRAAPWVTIGCVAAGSLAAGALVTGAVAYSASESQKDKLGSYPASHGDLEENSSKVKLWSDVTTALVVASGAVAGVTLWAYLSSPRSSDARRSPQAVAIGVGPGQLRAKVTF